MTSTANAGLKPNGNLSHVVGSKQPLLLTSTIPELLHTTVEKFPDRDALVYPSMDIRWSYAAFSERVDENAAGLLALGIEPGDRVALWAPNRPEWVVMQYATAHIGAILVNINPAYRLSELEYALNKVTCKAAIIAAQFKSSDYVAMMQELAPELATCAPGQLTSKTFPHLKTVIRMGSDKTAGMYNYDDVTAAASDADRSRIDEITASLHCDDAINIQFTSGTTGAPKGATLTHKNIVNNARNVVGTMAFSEQDRLCIPVPLYHCFGMVMGSLGCVANGAAMVFPGEAFEPIETLKTVLAENCTALYGVPTMFVAMMEHVDPADFRDTPLRTGIMAGAPCPIEVMKRVIEDMKMAEVTIAYGMTETSPVSFQSHVDDPLERRVSTVGRIHPHVEVKVIDENGNTVPVGVQGEACTRGYSVMQGYWQDPERTEESIDEDGWMHTGDLAVIDADGYGNIVGRVKDMLIRGGENVYPREIEEYLFRHPGIQEVQVFGVPDDRFGEEICAWIVARDGSDLDEDIIKDFCRGQIAHYKVPRYVRFRKELPMTVTGKPQKFVMRDLMIEELGLEVAKTA
jgi:fatty-acyl-CoA synthase